MASIMKNTFLAIAFSLMFNMVLGQSVVLLNNRKPSKKEIAINKRNYECLHRNKYSISQRLKFYPFNKAKLVKMVSFYDSTAIENRLPIINDTVDYSRLVEIKILTKAEKSQLTDVLYNIGYRAPNRVADLGMNCYNPHNAILFIDKNGSTFAYIEICFGCRQFKLSSDKIELGEFCQDKFDLIKKYFASMGIKTGITEHSH